MVFSEKIREAIRQYIGYIVIFLTSVVYVLTAVIRIDATGKTIPQIIGDSAVIFFLGVFFNRLFGVQGIQRGESDPRVVAAKELHGDAVMRIADRIDKLDEWCEIENAKNLKIQRTKILAKAGLTYDECFDSDGVALAKEFKAGKGTPRYIKRAERAKKRAFRKSRRLKLTILSAGLLTSEGGRTDDPFFLGRTKGQHNRSAGIKDILSKIGVAIVFGYYGIQILEEISYAQFIWHLLQILVLLVMGVVKMYDSYFYMVDEYKNRLVKKADFLQKFENSRKDGGINEQIPSNEPT